MKSKSFFKYVGIALAITSISGSPYAAQLEEIIVTAQKRAESLQDVPISMTALSGKKINDAAINSFADLSAYIPNIGISENPVATGVYMRGIGPGAQQSFEQSVGLYVDGIHMAKGRQYRTGLFDLQQVEVLAGPQGILFGKNTLAGAINVTSASANIGDEFGGKITLNKESFGGEVAEGHIAGSVSDTLAVRLAYKDRQGDGYLPNGYTGADSPTVDENMWRLSASWEPRDNISVKFKHAQSEHVRVGSTIAVTTFSPVENLIKASQLMYGVMLGVNHPLYGNLYTSAFPNFAPAVAAGEINAYRDAVSFGGCALEASLGRSSSLCSSGGEKPEGTNTETEDTSLNIEIELANGYTLTSVTGQAKYNFEDGIDADGLALTFIGRSDISEYEQNSQEFRIASPTDGKFSFIAGAYWEEQTQQIDRVVAATGHFGLPLGLTNFPGVAPSPTLLAFTPTQVGGINLINAFSGTPTAFQAGIPGSTMWMNMGRVSYWEQESEAVAVFFQGTYDISETVSLTGGLRYTKEDKDAMAWMKNTANTYGLPGSTDTSPTSGLATPTTDPLAETLLVGLFGTWNHAFDDSRSTEQLTPAMSLEWKPSETSMFYASFSEGFKSGGFNSVDDQKPIVVSREVAGTGAYLASVGVGDGTNLSTNYVPDRNAPGAGWSYDDETATSFEIGGKHTLLDGAMTFNWALFTSEYKDQQVSTFVGLGFIVANAASSDVDGFEMDVKWQATDNLLLGGSFAYLDASYGSFPGAGCTAIQASAILGLGGKDAAGDFVDLTPASPVKSALGCTQNFSTDGADGVATGVSQDISGGQIGAEYRGAIFAEYTRPMSNGDMWFAGVDVNFTDGFFLTGDLDPIDYQDGFEKVNIRVGLRGENWDLMLYGRNITDEITASGAADVPLAAGSHWRYMGQGETWGARVSYSF